MLRILRKNRTELFSFRLWSCRTVDAFIVVFLTLASVSYAGPTSLVTGQISKMAESTHLEFVGSDEWNYDVTKKQVAGKTIIEMRLPALNSETRKNLEKYSDTSVAKVSIDENGPDNSMIITLELTKQDIEFFDYLTEQPSRLILDIYPSRQANVKSVEKKEDKKVGMVKPKSNSGLVLPVLKKERAPASDINLTENEKAPDVLSAEYGKGIFDGADPNFERFSIKDYEIKESSIIRSKENVFIFFPMLLVENEHFNKIQSQSPVYSIIPRAKDEENEMARFLVTLFERRRFGVYLKTLNMFLAKYPRSEYDEIIRFMTADVYFELWKVENSKTLFATANRSYREAIDRHPTSKLADRSEFLMAYAAYNNKDFLSAIRSFERFIKGKPNSDLVDKAKLGTARSFLKLKKFEEAESVYKDVLKNGFSNDSKVEAAFLVGDVHFAARDYDKALSSYEGAIQLNQDHAINFPNAFYNMSEALFWKGKYKESLSAYKDYLKRFPSHPHGGYAMTRIGEILDILGANSDRVMGAWIETYFRYGKTPGAAVARMRTLSRKMVDMKAKEAEKAIIEIREITKVSELPKMDLFSTLMISEGLASRKQYVKAADELLGWYRANPTTTDGDIISKRMVRNINDELIQDVNNGDFMSALKVHNQFADQWLKGSGRIDTIFNLGKAFEQAGAIKQADQLYRESLNKLIAIKGTPAEKERGVFETLPSEDQLQLRLAKISTEKGQMIEAYEYLKQIQNPVGLSESEQIERVQISSRILESKGEIDSAKRYLSDLVNNWKGQVDLVVNPILDLAQLSTKSGDLNSSLQNLEKALHLLEDAKKVPSNEHARVLEQLGSLYEKMGKDDQTIQTWEQLLAGYDGESKSSIRYRLGELYFKKGNLQKSSEVWDPLKDRKNGLWYSLSQEKLKDHSWRTDYKKYIQRIPAMAELKQNDPKPANGNE